MKHNTINYLLTIITNLYEYDNQLLIFISKTKITTQLPQLTVKKKKAIFIS